MNFQIISMNFQSYTNGHRILYCRLVVMQFITLFVFSNYVWVRSNEYISTMLNFQLLDIHIPDIWTRNSPPFKGIAVYSDGQRWRVKQLREFSTRNFFKLNIRNSFKYSVFQTKIFNIKKSHKSAGK